MRLGFSRSSVLCAVLAMAALTAPGAAAPGQGVVVGESGDGLTVTVMEDAANVHFTYAEQGCPNQKPCLMITAGAGMQGIPATSSAACTAQVGNAYTPSAIQCPAQGIASISFIFRNGGTFSAYAGGGGQHAGGPCSPVALMVKTGGPVTSVNLWNGCHDTVYCDSAPSEFSAAEVDATDVVRGKCTSVIKH